MGTRWVCIAAGVLGAGVLTAQGAAAESQLIDSPCGSSQVTVSGESWLTKCTSGNYLSNDGGASWRQVTFDGNANDIAVDGHGMFYSVTGVLEVLNGPAAAVAMIPIDDSYMASVVVDGAGTLWGARCLGASQNSLGAWSLWRFNLPARTVTQVAQGGTCRGGDSLHVESGGQVFITESPTPPLPV